MEPAGTLKILFVVNPNSGAKSKVDWETSIRNYFKNLNHTIDFFQLDKNTGTSLQERLNSFKPERVIAVGGDGTVSHVAEKLLGSSMSMGILPAGSANGMAKELGIPDSPGAALQFILNGEIKCTDVIKINEDKFCIHLSDLGLNAQLCKYFEEGNLRGKLGYAKSVLKVLLRHEQMNVEIKSRDTMIRRNAFMVVLANASKYGTGALINPGGDLHDGLFEVVIIRQLSLWQFIKMFFQFKRYNPKKVETFHAQSVSIFTKRKFHFQVDGQYLGKINRVDAKILTSQLNLITSPKP